MVSCNFFSSLDLPKAAAQDQSQEQSTLRVSVNLVLLDATVKTKAGRIMSDLKKDDFEVREDGVPQRVEIFGRDELPLEVALVLDLSDSIGPFMGPLREAATTALGALKPEDQVALFTFATEAELRVPFTNDKSKIAEQFGSFKSAAPQILMTAYLSRQSIFSARLRRVAG